MKCYRFPEGTQRGISFFLNPGGLPAQPREPASFGIKRTLPPLPPGRRPAEKGSRRRREGILAKLLCIFYTRTGIRPDAHKELSLPVTCLPLMRNALHSKKNIFERKHMKTFHMHVNSISNEVQRNITSPSGGRRALHTNGWTVVPATSNVSSSETG